MRRSFKKHNPRLSVRGSGYPDIPGGGRWAEAGRPSPALTIAHAHRPSVRPCAGRAGRGPRACPSREGKGGEA